MTNDEGFRQSVWEAHELAIKLRGLLDATAKGTRVSVPYDELERFVTLASFIGGWRMGELDAPKEKAE